MRDDETICWRTSWNGQDQGIASSEYPWCHQQGPRKDGCVFVVVLLELRGEITDRYPFIREISLLQFLSMMIQSDTLGDTGQQIRSDYSRSFPCSTRLLRQFGAEEKAFAKPVEKRIHIFS